MGQSQSPAEHVDLTTILNPRAGLLCKHFHGTGTLKKGHQHADTQLNGTNPHEIFIAQSANQK